jgi:SlyX protein
MSNTTDDRITELEIKASFNEDLLDKLDQVIIRQQTQIDALCREVIALRQQTSSAPTGGPQGTNAQDELLKTGHHLVGGAKRFH